MLVEPLVVAGEGGGEHPFDFGHADSEVGVVDHFAPILLTSAERAAMA